MDNNHNCGVPENLRIILDKFEEHIVDTVTDPNNLLVEATEYFLRLNGISQSLKELK